MASEESKRMRIIEFALKKFMSVGVSSVTMDDIARGLGMGKGTLYKYFPSKEELAGSAIDYYANVIEEALKKILSDPSLTASQKLNLYLKAIAERLTKLNPQVLETIERSMPEVYERIEMNRRRIVIDNLSELLTYGIKNGLFDPEMDVLLVSHMMIGAVNHIVNAHLIENQSDSMDKLFRSITGILLKGCLSEEGRKQYQEM